MNQPPDLRITTLQARYTQGRARPVDVIEHLLAMDAADARRIWITRLSRERIMPYLDALHGHSPKDRPLYGIPFVIKDNIDLAGVPTTAGCPAFAYTPAESAFVVQRLIAAGAIPLGKTNLDQFATGLVGTRSPYGVCRNSFNADFVSGGSSSGSAVAVAAGLASVALGTDTAGSGRVPAAFNNLIGLKPSNGSLSTRGVVPACRSLDCVSIFALTPTDARRVLDTAAAVDPADGFARACVPRTLEGLRVGVPRAEQLEFFGDEDYSRLFDAAVDRITGFGGTPIRVDFSAFLEAARLLYEGPWVAERYAAVGEFIEGHAADVLPVTRDIILAGRRPSAADSFRGQYRLRQLARESAAVWSQVDLLMTPTTGTIYRVAELTAEPLRRNAHLGFYTNFMNLLDLAGVAVPAGFRRDGLPFGVTLVGRRGSDRDLLEVADHLQRASVNTLGAMGWALAPAIDPAAPSPLPPGFVELAVCGAHMDGLPLNYQLRERGGFRLECTTTAPSYRLYALPGATTRRPGMRRDAERGAAIDLEVWAMPRGQLGSLLELIPHPLGLGRVELASGRWVTGFVCEDDATRTATDITAHGGWRSYVAHE